MSGMIGERSAGRLFVSFELEAAVGLDYVGFFACEAYDSGFVFFDRVVGLGVVFERFDVPE